MKQIEAVRSWAENHVDLGYSLARIYLGVALFTRGTLMLANPESITRLAGANQVYMWYSYIIGAHLIGGLLLAFGVWTRLAALVQIPILVGAIFFIHLGQGLMAVGQSLELAALVLMLLVIFGIFGSGSITIRSFFDMRRESTGAKSA